MSLEYSDENELVYQAKAAAKDIVNAKYEVTKKAGDFLFLAHSEEEFYQRANAVDSIIDSTSTRRLASVSDSKSKLVKALFQEWEIKHASCEDCNPVNFNLPERVASPVFTEDRKGRKLWDKWSAVFRHPDGRQVTLDPTKVDPRNGKPNNAYQANNVKLGSLTDLISRSAGRMDNPEVAKLAGPDSVFIADPHGIFGPDRQLTGKKPKADGLGPNESPKDYLDTSKILSMAVTPFADPSSGPNGIMRSYHRCTGNTFQGFDMSAGSFGHCKHVHREGDGCGLTSEVAKDGSIQPGCGQHHIVGKAQTPSFRATRAEDGSSFLGVIPNIQGEVRKEVPEPTAHEKQMQLNKTRNPGSEESEDFTNPTEEQVGDFPPSSLWLLTSDQTKHWKATQDAYHTNTGGTGEHPSSLRKFSIGGKDFRVGDIVSTIRRRGGADPTTEDNLGVLLGTSSHRNGEHVRLGRSRGLSTNTSADSSMVSATPGEYSLVIKRINSPKTGKTKHRTTGVEPSSGRIVEGTNETTQYYPSSDVNVVEPFDSKKSNKGQRGPVSGLYSRLKNLQSTFRSKPAPVRNERAKTVNPTRGDFSNISFNIDDIFGPADD